jgi:hypothetical protein
VFIPVLTLLILILLVPFSSSYSSSLFRGGVISSSFVNHFNTVNGWIIHRFLGFGLFLVRYWDRGVLEAIGPTGLLNLFHYSSFKLEMVTGFIPHYILFTVKDVFV